MLTTKEIIRQVNTLEITTKKLVDGILAGGYHSVFKGTGMEFSEIREYAFGDDIRSIDWNVTARLDHPYMKTFVEERDLRVYFAFDFSGSGNFGNLIAKRTKSVEILAALLFSALRNNDAVGLFLFTDHVEQFIPARKGKKHGLKLLSNLVSYEASTANTCLEAAFSQIAGILKRRSVLFVISDFYDVEYERSLQLLSHRHDLVGIRVYDEREFSLPDVGLIQLEDEETGEQLLVDTSDETFREAYMKQALQKEEQTVNALTKYGVDTVRISTDQNYLASLRTFFRKRKHKVGSW